MHETISPEEDLRENLADISHQIWSDWMEYLFSKCYANQNGSAIIPTSLVTRWRRQIETSYGELSPEEKNLDREQADKIIDQIEKWKLRMANKSKGDRG